MGVHFPYTGVLGMVPAEINISKYPNLYVVAISHARSTGSLTNFQQSANVKASVPVKVLAKAVKGMTDTTVVSDSALRDLSQLGLITSDGKDLQRRTRGMLAKRKRRDSDSDDRRTTTSQPPALDNPQHPLNITHGKRRERREGRGEEASSDKEILTYFEEIMSSGHATTLHSVELANKRIVEEQQD